MSVTIDHNELEANLRDVGSTWTAAQAHGLLCSRLAMTGSAGCADWLRLITESADHSGHVGCQHGDTFDYLEILSSETYRQLSGRQSNFEPSLPDDAETVTLKTAALGEWCEGYLHGLVSEVQGDALRKKLAEEPIGDIIKDMLELTRAAADDDDEENEEAYAELVEYIRVAAQLVYEELSEFRHEGEKLVNAAAGDDTLH